MNFDLPSQELNRILENIQDTLYRADTAGCILWVSSSVKQLLGYDPDELIGKELAALYASPEERGKFLSALESNNGVVMNYEAALRRKDGSITWVSTSAHYYYDEQGKMSGVEGTTRDINDWKQAERALRESEQTFRTLAETTESMVFVYRETLLYVNPALVARTGYTVQELLRMSIYDLIHPDYRDAVKQRVQARLRGKKISTRYQFKIITKSGEERWLDMAAGTIQFEGAPAAVATALDVTEQKKAQEEIMRRAQQQAAVAELGQRALAGIDLSALLEMAVGIVAETLEADYCKVLELSPDEESLLLRAGVGWKKGLVGHTTVSIAMDSQAGYTLAASEPVIVEDLRKETRFNGPKLLHDHKVISGASVIIHGKVGPYGVLGVHTAQRRSFTKDDINFLRAVANVLAEAIQRKQAEELLARNQAHLAEAQHVAHLGNWVWYITANEVYWSDETYRIFNLRPQEFGATAEAFFEVVHPEDREFVERAANDAVYKNRPYNLDHRIVRPDGTIRFIHAQAEVLFDKNGGPDRMVGTVQDITERKRAEEALRSSETKYRRLVDSAKDAIFIAQDGFIKFPNPKTEELTGYSAKELAYVPIEKILAPEDKDLVLDRHRKRLKGGDVPGTYAFRIVNKTGERIWVDMNAITIPWEDKPAILVVIRDITENKKAEEILFQEKEKAQVTLQSIGDGVITTNAEGLIDYLNPVAEQLTGWGNGEAKGRRLDQVLNIVDEITRKPAENPVTKCLREKRIVGLASHIILIRRDGREAAIEDSAAPIRDRTGKIIGVVLVFHDVSEARAMAQKMSYQASHDALTGLINRREFELRLQQALEIARNEGKHHAMCYLDLDQFKVVNDTCGHVAGDEMLKLLAAQLQTKVRDIDTLARLGGDEFGILLEACPLEKAREIGETLRQAVRDFRFSWGERLFEVGVSIGLVPITANSGSLADVLSAADSACYVAKDLGRNRVHIYQPDDKVLAQRHGEMQWISRITRAIEENRFRLYYQNILPLADRTGGDRLCEILIRMRDEQGELVLPMAFLPAAERYNLISEIDRWVVRTTFQFLRDGVHQEFNRIAINLSGQSLSDDYFQKFVEDELRQTGVDPERICFEITETAAIANLSHAMHLIAVLKRRGCRFALDDFGSGLSSFAYLKSLQVDYLKIYGGFVRDMALDPIDFSMVEAINQIGHVMGIQTIAESVDNEASLEKLRELGVDYAQGFAIDKPKPLTNT